MKRFLPILAALLLSAGVAREARAASGDWPPASGDGFEVDAKHVHPSVGSALRAAGRYAVQTAPRVCVRDERQAINLHVDAVDVDGRFRDAVEEVIRTEQPGVVLGASGPTPSGRPPPRDVWVAVKITDQSPQKTSWSATRVGRGTVEVRVVGPLHEESAAVRFQDKPWVEDFPAFRTTDPGRQWAKGESTRPCATADEAARLARDGAAKALVARARENFGFAGVSDDRLLQSATQSLAAGRGVADRYTARYRRDYGTVYYEAVLVDASPSTLNELAGRVVHQVRVERASRLSRAGGGIIMAGVIGVLYLLANAFTKGYFAGRLRAAAVFFVVIVGGVLLLVGA